MATIPDSVLDHVLAMQLTVAWAGEARCEPPRMSWWQTDLVDPAGGGDFFQRLAPRTHRWAALTAVREAARRTEAAARKSSNNPDAVRSLFHLGFEIDERLDERLAWHRRNGQSPLDALPDLYPLDEGLDRELLAGTLRRQPDVKYEVSPVGRRLRGTAPKALELLVDNLVSAIAPLSDTYPMPHYLVKE